MANTYKVSVQLLNPDGTLAQQGQDSVLSMEAGRTTDRQALVLADSLQAGTYRLIVSVYAADDPQTRLIPSIDMVGDRALSLTEIVLR